MRVNAISLGIKKNTMLNTNKNENTINNYKENIEYAKVPQMCLVSFGSKATIIEDLLKGAKEVCITGEKTAALNWEKDTAQPSETRLKEIENEMAALALKSQEQVKLPIIKEALEKIQTITEPLSDFEQGLARVWKQTYGKATKLPKDFVESSTRLVVQACSIWEKAEAKNDFASFEPYLADLFINARKGANYINPNRLPMDVLLEDFGVTTAEVDSILGGLKTELVPLIKQISSQSKVNQEVLDQPANLAQMGVFSVNVLKEAGLNTSKVVFAKTKHPQMQELSSPFKIGIATARGEEGGKQSTVADCIDAFFTLEHEGGHGLVEIGGADKLHQTGLAGAELNIHESQSRLWENNVGRSKEFWQHYYPRLQKTVEGFENVKFDDFYNAMNFVKPSLIRIEADEVTYNMHVIIRHELEKEILDPKNTDDDIRRLVHELPQKWNEKYEQYLGVRPKTDSEGLLQDVHWSCGLIGYFPSYTLGNLGAAQFINAAERDIPDLKQRIALGDLKTLHSWLKENIYKDGKIYTPDQILQRATGESLNPKYFIEYLKTKYLAS